MGQECLLLHKSGERISLGVPFDMFLHEKETAVSNTELTRGTARKQQAGARRSKTQLLHGDREVLLMCNQAFITAMYSDSGMGIKKQKFYTHICIGENGTTK